jgi:proline iminopeptidase
LGTPALGRRGHSWGAALALFYALAHPERSLGVVYLGGTAIRWGFEQRAWRERFRRLSPDERQELARLDRRLKAGGGGAADGGAADPDRDRARYLRLIWSTDFATREAATSALDRAPLYEFPRADQVAAAVREDWQARLEAGIEDDLRRLDVPILVLHGDHDPDPDGAREVAELAPHGIWTPLAAAGHSPWLEQPGATRTQLRGFLGDLPGTVA